MATSQRSYRRAIPARDVIAVLEEWNGGNFPWTFAELEALALRVGYHYTIVPTSKCPSARTFHDTRTIWLTGRDEEFQWLELIHELSEILLQMPVAPEYVHPLTGKDEKHEVAKLVEKRASILIAHHDREVREERLELEHQRTKIEHQRAELERQRRELEQRFAHLEEKALRRPERASTLRRTTS